LQRVRPEVLAAPGYHLSAYDCPIKLNQNESPFDVPDDVKSEVLETVRGLSWSRYPLPMPTDLVEALAAHVGQDPDGVIVCNGSNTLIQLILAMTCVPDASVVVPSPSFSLYGLYGGIFGGRVVSVALTRSYAFDVPAIAETVRREGANVVVLCSPNNPTGCALSNPELGELLDQSDALFLIDEAYGEFSDTTSLDLLSDHANLIVLKTFSKAFGAAGIRVGYMVAHPELAREIAKGKIPFDINLFSHAAALRILSEGDMARDRAATICAERDRVFAALGGLEGVSAYPSQANFILFQVTDPKATFAGLVDRGVLVRDVTSYPMLDRALRVSIGTREENDRFLEALQETLAPIQ
jgi:histidinol-phosphate aminotransferase